MQPVREKETALAVTRCPPDVQAVMPKPAAARTPAERQLHELAHRQVQYEHERAPSKLKGAAKDEYDRLKKELDAAPPPADPQAMVARDHGPDAADAVIPGGRKKEQAVAPGFPTVLACRRPRSPPRTRRAAGGRLWPTG